MKYLTEVERKQRIIDIYNGFTFESTVDLSGTVIIHPPIEYNNNELSLAVSQFIGSFAISTLPRLKSFNGFHIVKYDIR